jgi:hypothetical protein
VKKRGVFFLIILCALAAVLGGCGKSVSPSDGEPGVGDAVQTAFFEFTAKELAVTAQSVPYTGEAASGRRLEPEEQYMIVTLSVKNTSGEQFTLYYDDFDLVVAQEEPLFPLSKFSDTQLPDEQVVRPGQTVEGDLIYITAAGADSAVLQYDEYFEGDTRGNSYRVQLAPKV